MFLQLYGDRVRYIREEKKWVVFDSDKRAWINDAEGLVWEMMIEGTRRQMSQASLIGGETAKVWSRWAIGRESTKALESGLRQVSRMSGITSALGEWNFDPWMAGLKEGWTLDLRTGSVNPSVVEDMITNCLGCGPPGKEDLLNDLSSRPVIVWLREMMQDDVEQICFIQKALYYTLLGVKTHKVWFPCFGETDTGKTLFLNLLLALLGDYGTVTTFDVFDAEKRSNDSTYSLASFQHKRLIAVDETEVDRVLDASRLKMVTGGAPIQARSPYGRPIRYQPQFAFWLGTNFEPQLKNDDGAVWGRTWPLEFVNRIPKDKQDKKLLEKLRAEESLRELLAWTLQGREIFEREGFVKQPARMEAKLNLYRSESDWLGQWIADDLETGLDENDGDFLEDLFAALREWRQKRGYRFQLSYPGFCRGLRDKGFETTKRRRKGMRSEDRKLAYLPGVRLREEFEWPARMESG